MSRTILTAACVIGVVIVSITVWLAGFELGQHLRDQVGIEIAVAVFVDDVLAIDEALVGERLLEACDHLFQRAMRAHTGDRDFLRLRGGWGRDASSVAPSQRGQVEREFLHLHLRASLGIVR